MRYTRMGRLNAWLLLCVLLLPVPLLAQAPGDLDTSFGVDGKVLTPIGGDNDEVGDVAVQPDGKIIVAGHATDAGVYFAVARYLPDGALDPTFGGDGVVITPFAGVSAITHAAAIQADGKIIVGGYTVHPTTFQVELALARYLPDGSLDPTFSGDGQVTTPGGSEAYEVLLQPDGKIVVIGTNVLARYLDDGTLDPTFGSGGLASADFSQLAGALQTDGKIVAAGLMFNTSTSQYEFALARYLSDGTLDVTFDSDGRVLTDVGDGYAQSVVVQPDGKIIAGGHSFSGANGHLDFTLVRYLPNGALDSTFDGDGRVTTDFGSTSLAFDLLLQPDGKIVAGGYAFQTFAIARYLLDGSLDLTFSGDGLVMTDFGPNDASAIQGLVIQPHNGRLVAGGSSTRTGEGGFDFALAGFVTGLMPGKGPPTHKSECKHGGWREFTIPRAFINQGDCIQFVNTGH